MIESLQSSTEVHNGARPVGGQPRFDTDSEALDFGVPYHIAALLVTTSGVVNAPDQRHRLRDLVPHHPGLVKTQRLAYYPCAHTRS